MKSATFFSLGLIAVIFTAYSDSIIKIVDIPFDREYMSQDRQGRKVEGYWADGLGNYPFPKANVHPWNGKEDFLKKLEALECLAHSKGRIIEKGCRGFSFSRLEAGTVVGSSEFEDTYLNIAWPSGLRQHYFDKFNVLPSREFYEYVMNFQP